MEPSMALRIFDQEEVSQITFVVEARDGGSPKQLVSNTTVVLTIIDEMTMSLWL